MHVLKIEVKEDFRCLKKGLSFESRSINLLVGEQGSGKSSLLECLNEHGQSKNKGKLDLSLSESALNSGVAVFYFDTEKHNPRLKDPMLYSSPDGKDKGIGFTSALVSRFKSHGEILKEFTVNAIAKADNCVLFIDEPESALSLRNQFKLVKEINQAVDRNVQFFIATHCLPLIESVDFVFSMEEFKWVESKYFIETQR